MTTQEKINEIVKHVNKGGGATQFHYLGKLFLSTFDKNYNLTETLMEVSRGKVKNIEVTDLLADQILNEIELSNRQKTNKYERIHN